MIRRVALVGALSLLTQACTDEGGGAVQVTPRDGGQDAGLTAVKLALNWFPEAEHGGFYAAQIQGFYRQRGVAVEILGGGPDAPVIQRVASGQVAFGITNADGVLNARAAGADVVATMAPYQTNPRCIVVHEHSGITSIDQLANITLALSQRPAFSHYLRWKYPFSGVTVVPYHGSIAPLIANPDYALQGYAFSEPVLARRQGASVRALLVADTGFNPYASVLITTRTIIDTHPDLVRQVTQAAVEGWLHYLEKPEQTNEHIHELNPELDLEILQEGARLSRPLVLDETASAHGLGYMTRARWELLSRQMTDCGVLEAGGLDLVAAYTTDFLPATPTGR